MRAQRGSVRSQRVDDFEWNFDPSAFCARERAFRGEYELQAYEDGRYSLKRGGNEIVAGQTNSQKRAKGVLVILFNHEVQL